MEEEAKRHLQARGVDRGGAVRKFEAMGGVRSTGDWGGKDLETTTAHLQTSVSHGACSRECVGVPRGSLTHLLSIWSGPFVRGRVLGLGPKPELMSWAKLGQTGLVPDFQLAFD